MLCYALLCFVLLCYAMLCDRKSYEFHRCSLDIRLMFDRGSLDARLLIYQIFEYQARRHEMKIFCYESLDLVKFLSMGYAREPEYVGLLIFLK